MYITVQEAARVLGLSPATVRRMVQRGELTGRKKTTARNSPLQIESDSVATFRQRQAQTR